MRKNDEVIKTSFMFTMTQIITNNIVVFCVTLESLTVHEWFQRFAYFELKITNIFANMEDMLLPDVNLSAKGY